jgi:hypothetical protein
MHSNITDKGFAQKVSQKGVTTTMFTTPSLIMNGCSLETGTIDTNADLKILSIKGVGKNSFKIYNYFSGERAILEIDDNYISGRFWMTSPNPFSVKKSTGGNHKDCRSIKVSPSVWREGLDYESHIVVKPSIRSQVFYILYPNSEIYNKYEFAEELGDDKKDPPLLIDNMLYDNPNVQNAPPAPITPIRTYIRYYSGSHIDSIDYNPGVPDNIRYCGILQVFSTGRVIIDGLPVFNVFSITFPSIINVQALNCHFSRVCKGIIFIDDDSLELRPERLVFRVEVYGQVKLELNDVGECSTDEDSLGCRPIEANRPLCIDYTQDEILCDQVLEDYNNILQALNSRYRDDRCALICIYPLMLRALNLPITSIKKIKSLGQLDSEILSISDMLGEVGAQISNLVGENHINVKPDVTTFVRIVKELDPKCGIYFALEDGNSKSLFCHKKGRNPVIIFKHHVEMLTPSTPFCEGFNLETLLQFVDKL